ncbi:MAG: DUF2752 domain-containing protein [Acidimicrobiales bacterium]
MTATASTLTASMASSGLARRWGGPRLVLAIAAAFAALAALATDDGPVLCPIRRCSGGYCPACGMTRSGGRLLRGDLAGSWEQHPFVLIALPQVLLAAAVWRFGARSLNGRAGSALKLVLALNVAVMATIWLLRMFNGTIPVPFFN